MISENRKSYKNVRRFNTSKINNGKQRYQYISQMIYFLENRSFDSVYCDLEILPILFKNDKNYKELIQDVYPILKLLVKLNSSKNVSDYSFKNILTQKLANHNRVNSPMSHRVKLSIFRNFRNKRIAVKKLIVGWGTKREPKR